MKCHGENTTTTKEVTKIAITKITIAIMVKRIGTRTARVPIRRRMIKGKPKDKDVYPYANKKMLNSTVLQDLMKISLPVSAR